MLKYSAHFPVRLPGWLPRFACATLLSCGLVVPAAQAAVVISNTALVNDSSNPYIEPNGHTGFLASNGGIPLDIVYEPLPSPSTLTFYKYSPTGQCANAGGAIVSAQSYRFDGGRYEDAAGVMQPLPSPEVLPEPGSGGSATVLDVSVPVSVCPTTVFHEGVPVFLTLTDLNRNADPTLVETIRITLSSASGDVDEVLELRETGPNTGIFAAVIQSRNEPVQQGDGKISVGIDGWVRGYYQDTAWPADESRAEALVDPFGILFDASNGNPVNGAAIWVLDQSLPGCAALNANATDASLDACAAAVFMDDGVTPHPARMTTGTTVPGNPVVPAGGFRFPLMAPGNYRFVVKTPTGFTVPSVQLPSCGLPPCANGFGRMIVVGSHLQPFVVLPGPALNIDIPADPVQAGLLLVKTASTTEAQAGDFLQYRLELTNQNTLATTSTTIQDVLPRGMRYQSGSLTRNGVALPDPVVSADGRTLTMNIGAMAGNGTAVIKYVVMVSADANAGEAVNTAQATGPTGSFVLTSNASQVAVRIREFLMSGRFTLIGRVFEDDCTQPFADRKGVPNVRIMLEDGTYVVTDKDGQYHIEGIRPGTHVVQMDTASLPKGAEPVSCIQNTRFAGNAYSQFVDVKGGGLWRADFHVQLTPPPPPKPPKPVISDSDIGIRLQTTENVEVSELTEALEARSYTFKGRFDSGQDVLLAASVKDLERLLAQLKKNNVQKLQIIGHTDSNMLGGASAKKFGDNYGLSLARAKTIADYLGPRLGLAASHITVEGKGPDVAVAGNDTAAGRAQNRRVEVIALGEQSSAKVGERTRNRHRMVIDTGHVPTFNLRAMIQLPSNLAYVKGSATIDGKPLADPEDMDGMKGWVVPPQAPKSPERSDLEWPTDFVDLQRVITFDSEVVRKMVTTKPAADRELTFRGSFEPAQAELMQGSVVELDNLLEQLRSVGSIERLEVIGHTDNQRLSVRARKIFPDNQALSLARARTIADSLAAGLGLESSQIVVEGYGPDRPVASNATPAGMAQNRRVEVNVYAKDAAESRLQRLCDDGAASIKASAIVDSQGATNVRLPTVENNLNCAGRKSKAAPAPTLPTVPATSATNAPAAASGAAAVADATPVDAPVSAENTANASNAATQSDLTATAVAAGQANAVDGNAVPEKTESQAMAAQDSAAENDSGRQAVALKMVVLTVEEPVAPAVENTTDNTVATDVAATDELIAEADIDWLARTTGQPALLFPAEGYNPRAPAVRVAVEAMTHQRVELMMNGEPVSALNADGARQDAQSKRSVHLWRGVPLKDGPNRIVARVRDQSGALVSELSRTVYFSNTPARVQLVPEKSKLIADGITRPVLAVRVLDRFGQPVRDGITGALVIHPPYMSWQQQEETQRRQLAGLDGFKPQYVVKGNDGIALIELAPTTESGTAQIDFTFQSETQTSRTQEIKAWLEPLARDWVMVGFAEGTVGYNTLKDNAAALTAQGVEEGAYSDGKISFYAKGRVLGKWLLTMAYDTSKERDRESLLSTIDPNEYYTLYGDGAEQRYDAASQSKMYLKLERGQFYALFGDYDTGLNETQLSRYNRTMNGFKTEKGGGMVVFTAYAAETQQNFARDEIQGNGTSGLYRLTQRNIVLNSEKIRIETRDRLHSEQIVNTRTLLRHIDYDIDYSAGTLFFKQPVYGQDTSFNPIWIVAEYETLGVAQESVNTGGRVGVNLLDGKLKMGVTALRDENNVLAGESRSDLMGADIKYRFAMDTELRLESATTDGDVASVVRSGDAWLAELEHHGSRYDFLLYTRSVDEAFGVGQQNLSESGQQKTGANGVLRLSREWAVQGELYQQENRSTESTRQAAAAKLRYEHKNGSAAIGVQAVNDSTDQGVLAGQDFNSTQLTLEATRRLLSQKLEVSAQAEVGESDSADYPNRMTLNASYAITDSVRLLAGQEFTDGSDLTTSTSRAGVQVLPWKGARLDTTLNQSHMSEYGPRTFAQFGLTQNLVLDKQWSMDFGMDSSQSVGSQQAAPVINNSTATSNALGLSTNSRVAAVTDDYWALSAGSTYRADIWSWTGRLESRNGDTEDRYGLTSNFLRQARDGVAFATGMQAFHTESDTGTSGNLLSLDLSWAWRPLGTQWSVLDRLEFKYEDAENTAGLVAPPPGGLFGFDSLVANDARSRRLINNLSLNRVSREWTGEDRKGNLFRRYERNQWSLYHGAKYALDTYDGVEYSGFTDMWAVEVRHDIRPWLDIGLQASALNAWSAGAHAYSFGPQVGASPVKNGWITLGWNIRGFTDQDFDAARYSAQGPYLQLRFKFDQNTRLNRDMVAPHPAIANEPLMTATK